MCMVRSPKIDQWSSRSHIRERTLQRLRSHYKIYSYGDCTDSWQEFDKGHIKHLVLLSNLDHSIFLNLPLPPRNTASINVLVFTIGDRIRRSTRALHLRITDLSFCSRLYLPSKYSSILSESSISYRSHHLSLFNKLLYLAKSSIYSANSSLNCITI